MATPLLPQTSAVVVHETLHRLGRHHEQVRPDRDDFVTVNWDRIKDNSLLNFYKAVGNGTSPPLPPFCSTVSFPPYDGFDTCRGTDVAYTFGLPYDLNSIMHYPSNL